MLTFQIDDSRYLLFVSIVRLNMSPDDALNVFLQRYQKILFLRATVKFSYIQRFNQKCIMYTCGSDYRSRWALWSGLVGRSDYVEQ